MDMILLDIPDVPGQSSVTGYEKKIEILSFSHGIAMQMTGNPSDKERTCGRPNHQDLTVSKYVDVSTCLLVNACNAATNLKQVKLTVGRNDAGVFLPYLLYTMENVLVSSVSIGGGGDRPTETLTLNYTKIQ